MTLTTFVMIDEAAGGGGDSGTSDSQVAVGGLTGIDSILDPLVGDDNQGDLVHWYRRHPSSLLGSKQELVDKGVIQVGVLQEISLYFLRQEQERKNRESALFIDDAAQCMLQALGRSTSIPWEGLDEVADMSWSDSCRAVGVLAGARLCEIEPSRIRISIEGDRMLAKYSSSDPAVPQGHDAR